MLVEVHWEVGRVVGSHNIGEASRALGLRV